MDKVAFHFGSFNIYWYGVLVAGGLLVGLWTASRRALRDNVAPEKIVDLGLWLILGTMVGARLLYVVSYWRENFAGRPLWEIFNLRGGGLVYYGGFVGACLSCIFYARAKKLPLWKIADILAPSIALGYAIGRFGCLMNGCCYGRPTSLPWGVRYPSDHPTYGEAVHPTQIYEALLNLGLYAVLAWLFRRKEFDGQIFAAYLIGYAILRSLVEFFRGDYTSHYLGGWATPAHVLSIVALVAGFVLLSKLRGTPANMPRPKP